MNEEELKERLLDHVREFCSKWNSAEREIYEKWVQEDKELRQKYPGEAYHYAQGTDWFSLFREKISPLFDAYCTEKKRVYGGKNARSFGFPVKFVGVDQAVATEVVLKTKSRAEVYIKTEADMDNEYLFVVLKKNNAWKIDSYKGRYCGDEKWENLIL